MGAALCAISKLQPEEQNSSSSNGTRNPARGGHKRNMTDQKSSMSDKEFFTSLATSTTLQLGSRNKFVNDIPSTLLQVATNKTSSAANDDGSRPSDGTLPFLQATLQKVTVLGLSSERAGALASYMTLLRPQHGEVFIQQDDELKGLYIVESGSVTLPGNNIICQGDSFGVEALLKKINATGNYTAVAPADKDAQLVVENGGNGDGSTAAADAAVAADPGGTEKASAYQKNGIRIWAIHRLMFQAVLIDMAKGKKKKKGAFYSFFSFHVFNLVFYFNSTTRC
jgi:hypothetical protein